MTTGGENWQPRNRVARAFLGGSQYPEWGQAFTNCQSSTKPERMFLQNPGVIQAREWWRLLDSHWLMVSSDFGLAMEASQQCEVYIIQLESDEFRCTRKGRCDGIARECRESWVQ